MFNLLNICVKLLYNNNYNYIYFIFCFFSQFSNLSIELILLYLNLLKLLLVWHANIIILSGYLDNEPESI